MEMLNFVEAWVQSIREFLESSGIKVRFERTVDQRPKASCVLNIRRDALEADLIVWESGEADLTTVDANEAVEQQHFDGMSGVSDLAAALARMLNVVRSR